MKQQRIRLLATSDIHGYVMPTKFGFDKNENLGLAKLAKIIEQKRSETPTLLIENGDFIQGSPLTYYQYKFAPNEENAMIALANAMQYDAGVFGNHEFNYGQKVVQQAVSEANYPYLAANIVDDAGQPIAQPYIVKEIEGVRIAILGLTTQFVPIWEAPAHIAGWHFKSAFETAKEWVPQIRATENIDIMVIAYHGGFENDLETGEQIEFTGENEGYQICKELDDVDIVITGHQHRLIETKLFGKSVIQPGTKGVCLGEITIDVTLDDAGKVISFTHEPQLHYIDDATIVHDEIVQLNASIYDRTDRWLDETIGTINGEIHFDDAFQARIKEHPYVELINNIQMDVSGATISSTALFHDEPGGLPSKVTMRDIVTNYIYPNTLVVLRLTGQDIIGALEQCASYFTIMENGELEVSRAFTYPKSEPYNYDMWEGIDYTFDIRKPVGERVVSVLKDGQPLQRDATYDVVMNNYRATGAGNFPMFVGKPVVKDIQIDMTEMIADYFMKHPIIDASCNDNWKVVY
ncbi:bifunctional metallophosphatase/5'-nucleotidase [Bacillus ndiopicus]|uniref:bifunctional metallophosphatase/5'-nucleotidase n=1 Tax=Bacillus ndiopicus TaxID=1347368 RepID=UPI0005AAA7BF|nr:bifunctional UDP-sugar hydrolase/5'-nucleotidase [Bacillus ndiopicus]